MLGLNLELGLENPINSGEAFAISYLSSIDGGDAAAVYSLRKAYASYGGSAIRVVRSSDSTQMDIGFVGEDLDLDALLTFAGAGNATVQTWYDQSGNARNATQTDVTKQPLVVENGVLVMEDGLPTMRFDGINDSLDTDSWGNIPQPFGRSLVVTRLGTIVTGHIVNSVSTNNVANFTNTNTHRITAGIGSSTVSFPPDDRTIFYSRFNSPSSAIVRNGVFSPAEDVGNSPFTGVRIGASNNSGNFCEMNFFELIVYPSLASDALITAIAANQNNYYSVF